MVVSGLNNKQNNDLSFIGLFTWNCMKINIKISLIKNEPFNQVLIIDLLKIVLGPRVALLKCAEKSFMCPRDMCTKILMLFDIEKILIIACINRRIKRVMLSFILKIKRGANIYLKAFLYFHYYLYMRNE